jgi:putative endonuclease
MGVPRTIRCMTSPREDMNRRQVRGAPSGAPLILFYTERVQFYYVYILQSVPTPSWIYVGYTENLKKRFVEHNKGDTPSTKRYKPFQLIHYEAYVNKHDAKRRELYLKTTKGKTTLRTMLKEYFEKRVNSRGV